VENLEILLLIYNMFVGMKANENNVFLLHSKEIRDVRDEISS